jgi:hypothetical protein
VKDGAGELERPHHARKNTRKWCKGVTGREHLMERIYWRERPNTPSFSRPSAQDTQGNTITPRYTGWLDTLQIDLCLKCGKQVWVKAR